MFQDLLQDGGQWLQAMIEQRPLYIAIGTAVLLLVVLYQLNGKKSAKLPFPYYYVKDNVVATLEEAKRDVK